MISLIQHRQIGNFHVKCIIVYLHTSEVAHSDFFFVSVLNNLRTEIAALYRPEILLIAFLITRIFVKQITNEKKKLANCTEICSIQTPSPALSYTIALTVSQSQFDSRGSLTRLPWLSSASNTCLHSRIDNTALQILFHGTWIDPDIYEGT